MTLLDTQSWVWWVHGDPRLRKTQREYLQQNESHGLAVSAISCWEVAKLVEYQRLVLPCPLLEWFDLALAHPGIRLIELTPRIIVESVQLPGEFHRDPADQIIVATARIYDCPLVTTDAKILRYPHVKTIR